MHMNIEPVTLFADEGHMYSANYATSRKGA